MARASGGVSAFARVLAVLDGFTPETPFLTLSEMAARASLPVSSAHRIVAELTAHGLLEHVEGHTYRLGNRLWELGAKTPGAFGLREIAAPFLRELHRAVGQHVQLGVLLETDVLVIERISARDAVVNGSIVGGRVPLQHSAFGLVLLAGAGPELFDAVVAGGMRPVTEAGFRVPADLRAAVEQTRRRGFAVTDGFIYPASRGVAVPVRDAEGVVGALGVVVPNDGSSPRRHVELLRETAEEIGRALMRAYLPVGHRDGQASVALRVLVSSSEPSMRYLEGRAGRRPARALRPSAGQA